MADVKKRTISLATMFKVFAGLIIAAMIVIFAGFVFVNARRLGITATPIPPGRCAYGCGIPS